MPRSSSQKSSNSCALWWSLKSTVSVLGSWSSENYFGTLRSSFMSQRAALSRAREPDWWAAAKGVGTYVSRVLMPKPTCHREEQAVSQARDTHAEPKCLAWITRHTNPPHFPIRTLKNILKFHKETDLQPKKFKLDKTKTPPNYPSSSPVLFPKGSHCYQFLTLVFLYTYLKKDITAFKKYIVLSFAFFFFQVTMYVLRSYYFKLLYSIPQDGCIMDVYLGCFQFFTYHSNSIMNFLGTVLVH